MESQDLISEQDLISAKRAEHVCSLGTPQQRNYSAHWLDFTVCTDLKGSFLLCANSHLLYICSVQLSFIRLSDNQHSTGRSWDAGM